jgi:hypothetical protein
MCFLAFGANFISSWIRIRIRNAGIRIRNTAWICNRSVPRLWNADSDPAT